MDENKVGLTGKYEIRHVDGTPVDLESEYFVLRLDGAGPYAEASRQAALEYAAAIQETNPTLASELIADVTYQENMAAFKATDQIPPEKPHRRLELTLKVGADDFYRLTLDLQQVVNELVELGGEREYHAIGAGPDSSRSIDLKFYSEMTHERYFEMLQPWLDSIKKG